jgi:asparagine synthase (glutamine-hydrolysing)
MSVQYGDCYLTEGAAEPDHLAELHPILAPYGPGATQSFCNNGAVILFQAYHTTQESRTEVQPYASPCGAVITWDGRLDNRADLLMKLGEVVRVDAPDVVIVSAAYERWAASCFGQLIGDWALSIWEPQNRRLLLARDVMGVRPLFYRVHADHVVWSTVLDSLILPFHGPLTLCQEYLAGWLSYFPAAHLTPYREISAVPPSCYIEFMPAGPRTCKYWGFVGDRQIRCGTDTEYEEQFRHVFTTAVRRRLRSNAPVIAELSGGMDSTSIVCVADELIACGETGTPRLDTLSCYDDSEPNWNERPYFEAVENRRGRTGYRRNLNEDADNLRQPSPAHVVPCPASLCGGDLELENILLQSGARVILSGMGGDEVTGGVPTPLPELADLLARARFGQLAKRLTAWALNKHVPWFHLLWGSLRVFLPVSLGNSCVIQPAPWIRSTFAKENREALYSYPRRLRLFGPLPSFQEAMLVVEMLRRQLSCQPPSCQPPFEKRYPYLDRDLLEFLFAIPREQHVRPGQRRSLMRRALRGIVPDVILDRRRKAFAGHNFRKNKIGTWVRSEIVGQPMVSESLGIVDAPKFVATVQQLERGDDVPLLSLIRTIGLELWLRTVASRVNQAQCAPPQAQSEVLSWET